MPSCVLSAAESRGSRCCSLPVFRVFRPKARVGMENLRTAVDNEGFNAVVPAVSAETHMWKKGAVGFSLPGNSHAKSMRVVSALKKVSHSKAM